MSTWTILVHYHVHSHSVPRTWAPDYFLFLYRVIWFDSLSYAFYHAKFSYLLKYIFFQIRYILFEQISVDTLVRPSGILG
jgi:hypothetical protein